MKKINFLVFILGFGLILSSCGGGKEVTVKVSGLKLGSAEATSINSVQTNSSVDTSISTIAHVDGLKIKIKDIKLVKNDNSEVTVLSYSPYKEVTLTQDGNNANVLTDNGTIESGTYINAGISYMEEYSLKAWACLGTTRYYTSTSGTQSDTVASGTCDKPTASDYGYQHYDFLYTTTAQAPDDTSDTGSDSNQYFAAVTVDEDTVSNLQFLFDIYRTVRFWNGSGDISGAGSPFTWSNNNGKSATDFFPAGLPHFGTTYIPIHISVNDSGTTSGEIYAIADSQSKLDDYSANYDNVDYLSVAFKSDTSWNSSRIVGFDNAGLDLNQFNSGVVKSGSNYSIKNGEHCPSQYFPDGSDPKCHGYSIQDVSLTGFHRVNLGESFTVTEGDGPDCYDGSNAITEPGHSEWGRRNKDCGISGTLYFKRVR